MMEIDDEELLARIVHPEPTFQITEGEARQFLLSCIRTYTQFDKFPHTHRSYKTLRRTGAIYQFIYDKLCEPRG